MTVPVRSGRNACFGFSQDEPEGDDPVCRTPTDAKAGAIDDPGACAEDPGEVESDGPSHAQGAPPPPDASKDPCDDTRLPDYVAVSVAVGSFAGVVATGTLDRHGNVYLGVGVTGGKSTGLLASSMVAGYASPYDGSCPITSEKGLRGVIAGDAYNIAAGAGPGIGVVSSSGGSAIEAGRFSPQLGVSFQHTWNVRHVGIAW